MEQVESIFDRAAEFLAQSFSLGFVPSGCFCSFLRRLFEDADASASDSVQSSLDTSSQLCSIHKLRRGIGNRPETTGDLVVPRSLSINIAWCIEAAHEVARQLCTLGV